MKTVLINFFLMTLVFCVDYVNKKKFKELYSRNSMRNILNNETPTKALKARNSRFLKNIAYEQNAFLGNRLGKGY